MTSKADKAINPPIFPDTASPGVTAVHIDESMRHSGGTFVRLGATRAYIDALTARDLGAWLAKRYSLPGWAPADGDIVRILPDAQDDGDRLPSDATQAQVERATPDSDGEIRVALLDDADRGDLTYVLPDYIAHVDAPRAGAGRSGRPESAAGLAPGRPR